ncbi:TetR/AcrR family transcriptional regulator [Blautia schinkii]|nr:TetR/AcrR family transcriptional regulator [Blautia schinkii]
MDDTREKIIDAAMTLVRDKGYAATTTKDIANFAGVNECTLFRKFKSKREIVLRGMELEKWCPHTTIKNFANVRWELEPDLELFMKTYMDVITPDFVNLSIGLRAPQLYNETAPVIMKVPKAYVSALVDYFKEMERRKKLPPMDFESLAMTIFSSTFGYTFLKASFKDNLTEVNQDEFIKNSVKTFINGIPQI